MEKPTVRRGSREVLKDVLNVAAQLLEVGARQAHQVVAVEEDVPGTRRFKADERTADSGLAAARFPDEAEGFAGIEIEADLFDGVDAALDRTPEARFHVEAGDELVHAQHGFGAGPDRSRRLGRRGGGLGVNGEAHAFGLRVFGVQQGEGRGIVRPPHGAEARHGGEQRAGVGMTRLVENLGAVAFFHGLAVVHDEHAVGHFRHHAHIVGDEDDRHVHFFLQLADKLKYLRLNGHVERGGGLVGNEQGRLAREGHGDHDALAHPARKLVGVVAQAHFRGGDAHLTEEFRGFGQRRLAGEPQVPDERLRHLVPHPDDRIEGGHGFLKDHADVPAAHALHAFFRERGEVIALKEDAAPGQPSGFGDEAQKGAGGHALAAARFAHQTEGPARPHGEGHVAHHVEWAVRRLEAHGKAFGLKQGRPGEGGGKRGNGGGCEGHGHSEESCE